MGQSLQPKHPKKTADVPAPLTTPHNSVADGRARILYLDPFVPSLLRERNALVASGYHVVAVTSVSQTMSCIRGQVVDVLIINSLDELTIGILLQELNQWKPDVAVVCVLPDGPEIFSGWKRKNVVFVPRQHGFEAIAS